MSLSVRIEGLQAVEVCKKARWCPLVQRLFNCVPATYLYVVQVGEDEGLLQVEAARDDVLHVLVRQPGTAQYRGEHVQKYA